MPDTPAMLSAETVRFLVVHCSDTPADEPLGARGIHSMHLGFGWDGIGYHAVIDRDGTVERGRPEYWVGAHVKGHNHESLGVCLIGQEQFTEAQMDALEAVLKDWKGRYPAAQIRGHRDFPSTEKTCPNFDAGAWAAERRIA